MKNRLTPLKDQQNLELTRHENFIDGRADMFDLLAQKQVNEAEKARILTER